MRSFSRWAAVLLSVISLNVYSSTGRIIFTGYIYQSPCEHTLSSDSVTYRCRQGTNQVTQSLALTSAVSYLPRGLGTSTMSWVNSRHSLGVLNISYR